MFLAYDGIVFDVLLLNSWDINAIMSDDGVDFLYWHHLIDITCVINPEVNAAIFFPPNPTTGINRVLRSRNTALDTRLTTVSAQLPPLSTRLRTGKIGEQPNKSPISTPAPAIPPAKLPTASGADTFFLDSIGTTSEQAGTEESFPPATDISSGISYSPDLAVKTGPLAEPIGGNWVDQATGIDIAPMSLENTRVNQADSAPDLVGSATQGALGGVIGLPAGTIGSIVEGILGSSRPTPNLPKVPAPSTQLVNQPPPAKRSRFPGNANFPASDIELRDRLQVPRRKLMVWINSGPGGTPEFILNLPYDGCSSDATSGPRCADAGTQDVHANVTGVKRLVFECHEALPLFYEKEKSSRFSSRLHTARATPNNPVPQRLEKVKLGTPPIISNRWEMKQIPDPRTYLNTTVIQGKAVFRMDVLSRMQITADQLRPYIMPPIPAGYVRRPPEVTQTSGGEAILYTIIDDQQMMNNPSGQRWGVHSVTIVDSVLANNPIDMFGPVFKTEGNLG